MNPERSAGRTITVNSSRPHQGLEPARGRSRAISHFFNSPRLHSRFSEIRPLRAPHPIRPIFKVENNHGLNPRLAPHRVARNPFASLDAAIARQTARKEAIGINAQINIQASRGRIRFSTPDLGVDRGLDTLVKEKSVFRVETSKPKMVEKITQPASQPEAGLIAAPQKLESQAAKAPILNGREKVVKQIEAFLAKPQPQRVRLTQLLTQPQEKVLQKVGTNLKTASLAERVVMPNTQTEELPKVEGQTANGAKLVNSDQIVLAAIQRSLISLEQQTYPNKQLAVNVEQAAPAVRIATQKEALAALMTGETTQVQQAFADLKVVGGVELAGQQMREAVRTKANNLTAEDQIRLLREMVINGNSGEDRIILEILARKIITERVFHIQVYEPGMRARQDIITTAWDRLFVDGREVADGYELIRLIGPQTAAEKSPILPDGKDDGSGDLFRESLVPMVLSKDNLSRVIAAHQEHPTVEVVEQVTTRKATDREVYEVLNEQRERLLEFAMQKGRIMLARLIPV